MTRGRVALIAFLAAAIAAFFLFDVGDWLTLERLKGSRDGLAALAEAEPVLVVGAFFLAYVAATALSLPGAGVLTRRGRRTPSPARAGCWGGC